MAAICNHTSDNIVVHILTDLHEDARHMLSWPRFSKVHPAGSCWAACVHEVGEQAMHPAPVRSQFAALRSKVESHPWSRNNFMFMYKVMLHHILPSLQRVIVLDHDMLVLADLRRLWSLFEDFRPAQMLGLTEETQPTYHPCGVVNRTLRRRYGNRRMGYLAFNGGLQLLDLAKMRANAHYNAITSVDEYSIWTDSHRAPWSVGGGCIANGGVWDLGDQDFYALLGMEHPEWFYTLPCSWNVQLSTYHHQRLNLWPPGVPELKCAAPPAILHGNYRTNALFPDYLTPSCGHVRSTLLPIRKAHPEMFREVEDAFCTQS